MSDDEKTDQTNETVYQLFEAQVEKTPHKVALVFENQQMTYQELNEHANQLAHYIRKQKPMLKPDTRIAICLERSCNLLIAMLGIMKAGAAYVPIDTKLPVQRIKYMLDDTESILLITQEHLLPLFDTKTSILTLDDKPYLRNSSKRLKAYAAPNHLAYVIYTSGTTGKPKGVMINHQSVVNLCHSKQSYYDLNEHDHVLGYASASFDAAVGDIFPALSSGATLHLLNESTRKNAAALIDYLETCEITVALIPPVVLSLMTYKTLPKLRALAVAGEKAPQALIDKWCVGRRLINEYGPTEGTVCISMHDFKKGDIPTKIGKPLPHINAYVLDEQLNPVSTGTPGELHIGGICLAQGYLHQPELTQTFFVSSPWGDERLYKTGDLVKRLPDGCIEYIGRRDSQVKRHGYRIELGEIESVLNTYSGIKQVHAATCTYDKQQKKNVDYLVGYYVSDKPYSHEALQDHLSAELPAYMLPNAFVWMEKFPVTVNGKLDKDALPSPNFKARQTNYAAPRTAFEAELVSIWQRVLQIKKLGIYDDFYTLGGDSILLIQLISALREVGITLSEGALLKYQCIAKLMDNNAFSTIQNTKKQPLDLDLAKQFKATSLSPKLIKRLQTKYKIQAIYPVTDMQAYFLDYTIFGLKTKNTYLNARLFEYKIPLKLDLYEKAWLLAIKTYPALRACFNWKEQWVQIICKSTDLDFKLYDISLKKNRSKLEARILKREEKKPFNLKNPPLLRVRLIKLHDTSFKLLLDAHHAIFDGWSESILVEKVHEYYHQLLDGITPTIEEDTAYFHAQQYLIRQTKNVDLYWKQRLPWVKRIIQKFNHACKNSRAYQRIQECHQVCDLGLIIKADEYDALVRISESHRVTLAVLMQFAWHKTLYTRKKQSKTVVATTLSGRMIDIVKIGSSVGCYIRALPIICDWQAANTTKQMLKKIHENMLKLNEHSIVDENLFEGELDRIESEIIFQNTPHTFSPADVCTGKSKVSDAPIHLEFLLSDKTLDVHFVYNFLHFSHSEARKLLTTFQSILHELIEEFDSNKG